MSDLDLVNNIKQDILVDESITGLLEFHGALINRISSKYTIPLQNSGSSAEEIMKERFFIIYKAAQTYKEDRKTKFSSYLGSYTRWYCLNKINKKEKCEFVGDEHLENHPAEIIDHSTKEHIHFLMEKIQDPKIKKVLEMRYFSGGKTPSWSSIGKVMGVSGQSCNNWFRRGVKLINGIIKETVDSKN